jgi:hypothetical protein
MCSILESKGTNAEIHPDRHRTAYPGIRDCGWGSRSSEIVFESDDIILTDIFPKLNLNKFNG